MIIVKNFQSLLPIANSLFASKIGNFWPAPLQSKIFSPIANSLLPCNLPIANSLLQNCNPLQNFEIYTIKKITKVRSKIFFSHIVWPVANEYERRADKK